MRGLRGDSNCVTTEPITEVVDAINAQGRHRYSGSFG